MNHLCWLLMCVCVCVQDVIAASGFTVGKSPTCRKDKLHPFNLQLSGDHACVFVRHTHTHTPQHHHPDSISRHNHTARAAWTFSSTTVSAALLMSVTFRCPVNRRRRLAPLQSQRL